MSQLLVLTGPRGSGKSTLCGRVADTFRQRGYVVGGVITERGVDPAEAARCGEGGGGADSLSVCDPSIVADRRFLRDLGSGVTLPFGHRGAGEGDGPGQSGADDSLVPGWAFADEVFARGEEAILAARKADLLVVDELGPLELVGGRGWQAALAVLRAREYRAALVVCRPELLSRLSEAVADVGETARDDRHTFDGPALYSLEVHRRAAVLKELMDDLAHILGAPGPVLF
jgi:hypothetical protein